MVDGRRAGAVAAVAGLLADPARSRAMGAAPAGAGSGGSPWPAVVTRLEELLAAAPGPSGEDLVGAGTAAYQLRGRGDRRPPLPAAHGGAVLSVTIDRCATADLRPRRDGDYHVESRDLQGPGRLR